MFVVEMGMRKDDLTLLTVALVERKGACDDCEMLLGTERTKNHGLTECGRYEKMRNEGSSRKDKATRRIAQFLEEGGGSRKAV